MLPRVPQALTPFQNALLELEISDDGRGLPAQVQAGVGLLSLRERAAELGGTCRIEPGRAGGTRVRACLPLPLATTAETDDNRDDTREV